jgi:hypothetical protein
MRRRVSIAALLLLSPAALAQVDFSGSWQPAYHEDAADRIPGPEIGDYMGLPLNDAARLRADSFDADRLSMVMQYQCRPHSSDYGLRGLGNMRVTREIEPQHQKLVAFHTYMPAWGSTRTIWLDGRSHPPEYAEHTFQGFSTGVWDGNQLTVTTTHLKENYYRRNEVPASSERTVTEHWIRHGDILTVVTVEDDPVFFTEPLVRSQNWYLDPSQRVNPFYCEYVTELPPVTEDSIPHHLPGENEDLTEMAGWYGLPLEVLRGGAEKMYPEYKKRIPAPEAPPPAMCQRQCNCVGFRDCL